MAPDTRRRAAPKTAGMVGGIVSLLGLLAVLGGGAWVLLAMMFMGLDTPQSTLTLLIAAPGLLVALLGLGLMFLGSRPASADRSR